MTNRKLQLESSRTSALLKLLNRTWGERAFFVKIHGSPFQPRLVDILGCFYGQYVALEVKRPGNKPTPRQVLTLHKIRKAGGVFAVVWSDQHVMAFLSKLKESLDSLADGVYLDVTNTSARRQTRASEESEIHIMPAAKTAKAKAGKAASVAKTTSKKSAPVIEDEDDELDDLDDLDELDDDDFEDDEEDGDDEDEEDEDEPEPVKVSAKRKSNDAVAAKSAAAKKPGKVTVSKTANKTTASAAPAKKSKSAATVEKPKRAGNASNLKPRRVAEGMVGVSDLATEFGSDGRAVRVILRRENVAKSADGLYQWKANSRDLKAVQKVLKTALAK